MVQLLVEFIAISSNTKLPSRIAKITSIRQTNIRFSDYCSVLMIFVAVEVANSDVGRFETIALSDVRRRMAIPSPPTSTVFANDVHNNGGSARAVQRCECVQQIVP